MEPDKIKKSLRYSIIDGTFYSMMVGFGESFFTAFAVFMKADNFVLAILGSLPQTLGSYSQLLTHRLILLLGSRKRLICLAAMIQALMHIPIIFTFFFGELRIYYLITFICLYWIVGMIGSPAWNSWMGELVEVNERGGYFGRRNKIAGLASFFSFIVAGFILERFSLDKSAIFQGFFIIFAVALVMRLFSFIHLAMKYEPEYKHSIEKDFTFWDFLKEARHRNFGLFVIFMSGMNFSWYISAPFFTPYMLNDLKMDYITFTVIQAVSLITKFLMMPFWGKACDKYGTKKTLALAGFLMPFSPLLWVISTDFWFLVFAQVFSGFSWAGFEMATMTFVFDATSAPKRAKCVAFYNVLSGTAILLGALAGGLIVRYNHFFWSHYYSVFIISGIMRYLMSIIFIPKLKEVRLVEPIEYTRLLFSILTIKPNSGIVHLIIPLSRRLKSRLKR